MYTWTCKHPTKLLLQIAIRRQAHVHVYCRRILVWRHMLFPHEVKKFKGRNDEALERARQYPIENVYKGVLKKTGRVLVGSCPFHQEDTPSFTVYPDNNTWYCFGCHEAGDVIKLYCKINNCSFKEALEALK